MSRRIVLNTRPREQAGELSRLLTAAGFEAVEAPAIDVVEAWTAAERARVEADVRDGVYAWVALASRNAGLGLADTLRELGSAAPSVVCGAATARALGIKATISLDRFSAAAALSSLQARVSRHELVLVPRAAEGRDELVEGLRALGAVVQAPVAYRTEFADEARRRLRQGGIDVVTACSPSAIASLMREPDLLASVALVCLGETTAAAARAAGLRVAAVAARTTMAALVQAVATAAGAYA